MRPSEIDGLVGHRWYVVLSLRRVKIGLYDRRRVRHAVIPVTVRRVRFFPRRRVPPGRDDSGEWSTRRRVARVRDFSMVDNAADVVQCYRLGVFHGLQLRRVSRDDDDDDDADLDDDHL